MKEVKNGLLTNNYTKLFCEDDDQIVFNAPHHFTVVSVRPEDNSKVLAEVNFQKGPIKENGINGISNEDLIIMVVERLSGFQNSDYKCRENAIAITKFEEGLMWLRKRTNDRIARNVEGTSKV